MPKLETDIYSKLQYYSTGVYDNSNLINKQFIDELLDEVKKEYGLVKGSDLLFNVIQSRLYKRIESREVATIGEYVKGDLLLINEALSKGFNVGKPIDLVMLKEKNLNTISETLDKYYNSIIEKVTKEKNNLQFYLDGREENLIAAGGPSYSNNIGKLAELAEKFNNDVRKALKIEEMDNEQEVLIKEYIDKLKEKIVEIEENQENIKEESNAQKETFKEIPNETAGVISSLLNEYKMKESRRFASDAASIDFYNLEDQIKNVVKTNQNNKDVAMEIAKIEPFFISFVSEELQSDMDVVKEIVKNHPNNAEMYVDKDLIKKAKRELSNNIEENRKELDENSPLLDAASNNYEQSKGRSY